MGISGRLREAVSLLLVHVICPLQAYVRYSLLVFTSHASKPVSILQKIVPAAVSTISVATTTLHRDIVVVQIHPLEPRVRP